MVELIGFFNTRYNSVKKKVEIFLTNKENNHLFAIADDNFQAQSLIASLTTTINLINEK